MMRKRSWAGFFLYILRILLLLILLAVVLPRFAALGQTWLFHLWHDAKERIPRGNSFRVEAPLPRQEIARDLTK
ncbi:MAG: hypothetical protein LBT32_08905 [Peptococcaceae bacterium]|jgi:hypothetical protein|nr:hypothetical protein [Peptococcaceae bacterium]